MNVMIGGESFPHFYKSAWRQSLKMTYCDENDRIALDFKRGERRSLTRVKVAIAKQSFASQEMQETCDGQGR